jgi:non-specific serine/threonine protein kinase
MEQTLSQPVGAALQPPAQHPHGGALLVGTRLREFEIRGTIGEGGFSIVYAAFDQRLGREVAIKEYIPASLAGRGADASVRVRSEQHRESFDAGLAGFMNEARLLAQFKHPALVEVLQFWEENGTAYMVMPRYRGRTLRQELRERGGRCDERWLKLTLAPVLDVLELMHSRNVFHRDIAPDNILVQEDGSAVLLDLGSAREILGDRESAVTVVVKPGYAPLEQYSGEFALPQGPWTDVYAFGALLHFAVTGSPPQASISRVMKDSCQPLAGGARAGFSPDFLAGIDAALALQPAQRPQSARALREALGMDQTLAAEAMADAQAVLAGMHHDDAITEIVSAEEMADIVDQVARAIGKPLAAVADAQEPSKAASAAAAAAPPTAPTTAVSDVFSTPTAKSEEPVHFADIDDLMQGRLLGATEDVRVVSESRLEARIDSATDSPAPTPRSNAPVLIAAAAALLVVAASAGFWLLQGGAGSESESSASEGAPVSVAKRLASTSEPQLAAQGETPLREKSARVPSDAPIWGAASDSTPVDQLAPDVADHAAIADTPLATTDASSAPESAHFDAQSTQASFEVPLSQPAEIWASASNEDSLVEPPVTGTSTVGAETDSALASAQPVEPSVEAPASARAPTRKAAAPAAVNVRLQVLPWGEVFVDGRRVGISPPLKQLALSPGRHRIELRNGEFAPHVREIEVSAGEPVDVEHRFASRP